MSCRLVSLFCLCYKSLNPSNQHIKVQTKNYNSFGHNAFLHTYLTSNLRNFLVISLHNNTKLQNETNLLYIYTLQLFYAL